MKLLKLSLFVIVLLALAIPAFAQDDAYFGKELYYDSGGAGISEAVYSPDGNWIAFAAHDQFFVVPAEGGDPVFIYMNEFDLYETTPHENCDGDGVLTRSSWLTDLCFTPDSKEITFMKTTIDEDAGTVVSITPKPGGSHSISISGSKLHIASVNIFTGELRTISDGESPIEGKFPTWSSDGRYLCYYFAGEIKTLDTETGELWRLTGANYTMPMFTPDDAYIMCHKYDGKLYRIPFEGGTPELVATAGAKSIFTDISSDGTWILNVDRGDPGSLSAYNTLTDEFVTLLTGNEKNGFNDAVFSPDGTKVCYIRENDESYRDGHDSSTTPYTIDFDPNGNPYLPGGILPIASEYGTKIDFVSDLSVYEFALSPDEQWIVFNEIFNPGLLIASAEGGERTLLFKHPSSDLDHFQDITFSPDSKEIYFRVDFNGGKYEGSDKSFDKYNIECVNIVTGEHRVVIEGAHYPSWSRDGRYLVYINYDYMINVDPSQAVRNGVISIYDSVTGETRYLADGEENAWTWRDGSIGDRRYVEGTRYLSPSISPDGSKILCSMHESYGSDFKICTIPFAGGEPEILPINGESSTPKYSPDGKWIICWGLHESINYRCFLYNVETTETVQMVDTDCDPRIFNMGNSTAWSSDGSKIYYVLKDLSEEHQIYVLDFDSDRYLKAVTVESETPESFAVMSNYPNPFNPTTTIEFILPEAGFTKLVIYNIMGQKIRELVSADMPAGVHSIAWDGCDEHGTPASSGLFVSRLTSGVNVVSNRMMLVK